jgi:hypothetical protein
MCPNCGGKSHRDYVGEHGGANTGDHWRGHASEALAVQPDQISEAMAEDKKIGSRPDHYDREGRPVFTSLAQKRKYCRDRGFYDRSGFLG